MNILFFSFFLLFGCSSGKQDSSVIKKNIPRKIRAAFRGPSRKGKNLLFQDKKLLSIPEEELAQRIYSVDLNGDGKEDLVTLSSGHSRPIFFLNTGIGFKKLSYDPFPEPVEVSFLVFADFNKDQILDVITVSLNKNKHFLPVKPELYIGKRRENRISYKLVPNALPLAAGPTSTLTMWDFNKDGLLDLFVGNWFNERNGDLQLRRDYILWGEKGGLRFSGDGKTLLQENKTLPAFPLDTPTKPTFSADVCELGGKTYLLTTSTHGYKNRFWKLENNKFKDVARNFQISADTVGELKPRSAGHTLAGVCDYISSMSRPDVFLGEQSHSYDPLDKDLSSFISLKKGNVKNRRKELEFVGRPSSFSPERIIVNDYDSDGYNDLLIENTGYPPHSKLELWSQNNGRFTENGALVGIDIPNPTGISLTDFNGDGQLDIVVGQSNVRDKTIKPKIYFFQKNSAKPHYLFKLQGKKSNIQGLGAVVKIQTSNRVMRTIVKLQHGGLPGQSAPLISFALRSSEKLEKLIVNWPYKSKKGQSLIGRYKVTNLQPGRYRLCENGRVLNFNKRCY
jgi:hypothetical protein